MGKKKEPDTFTLTDWEDDVCANVRARVPGIAVTSLEEPRVIASLCRVSSYLESRGLVGREIIQWSCCGVRHWKEVEVYDEQSKKQVRTWRYENRDADDWVATLLSFASKQPDPEAPEDESKARHLPSFLILCDPGPFLDPQKESSDTNLRALREAMWRIREEEATKTIFLVGGHVPLPDEIAADVYLTEYKLPTPEELGKQFSTIIDSFKKDKRMDCVKYDDNTLPYFTRACAGLPEYAARSVFNKSIARYLAFDQRAVALAQAEKEQIVKRSGIAEIQQPRGGLEMVGGLEHFKGYVNEIDELLQNMTAARKYGLKLPSGIMLMGVSGTGKSLVAEALGGHFKLPILRLDMGSMFGKFVGESESRFRQFKILADALQSCIVYCDEFEKGIGGGDGETDGGTTERVKQALLSWLQEKSDSIMFVGTVNSISPFEKNPEMLRSGRFDSIWFVDLPDARARLEILAIHLKAAGHSVPQGIEALVEPTYGYSGAELENAVQTALRWAFQKGEAHAGIEGIEQAVKSIVPLAKTMGPQLHKLREFVLTGKARPAGALLNADQKKAQVQDRKGLETFGVPELL